MPTPATPLPPLRWGILGVAAINQRLLPAFRASATAGVQAIASRSLDRARVAAAEAGIPTAYGNYDALLADPNIDAVYVPLPNHLHLEWAEKAARAGKHVLCEKPLTLNAAEAERLVATCAAANVRLMDGFMWPHHPRTAKLKSMLDAGAIGEVRKVVAAFSFQMDHFDPAAPRMIAAQGGGSLLDVGCYTAYAIRWAMGAEPTSVVAKARYVHGVDVELSAVLSFADGRTALMDCGFDHPLRTHVEIVGTTGTIRVPNLWIPDADAAFEIRRQSGDFGHAVEVVTTPGADQMVAMLDHFAEAVHEARDCRPHPTEAIKTARVTDALAQSAREGREVAVAQG